MKEQFDLVVIGDICCDLIFTGIDRLPNQGEEVWAKQMKITIGGVFNVAAAASRLNLKAGIPCVYGTDVLSQFIHTTARNEGIDTQLFLHIDGPYEQASVVLNFGNDRAFISYASKEKEAELNRYIREIAETIPMTVAVFGMSKKENDLECMNILRSKGTKVVLDCCWDEELLQSEWLLKQIMASDYFLPNEAEARVITGEENPAKAIMKLAQYNPNVVIKCGKQGVMACVGGQVQQYPAIDLGKVVDTTGAGDNFVAGFSYGLIQKKSIEDCIYYGQLCGSKSTVAVGGFASSLYESELHDLAKSAV